MSYVDFTCPVFLRRAGLNLANEGLRILKRRMHRSLYPGPSIESGQLFLEVPGA